MPIGKTKDGQIIYTSARDIGNIGAGYIAGSNGMPWGASRIAFDTYQSIVSEELSKEGISTRNAEYYGWLIGSNIHQLKKMDNLKSSINSTIKHIWNKIKQ